MKRGDGKFYCPTKNIGVAFSRSSDGKWSAYGRPIRWLDASFRTDPGSWTLGLFIGEYALTLMYWKPGAN